MEINSFSARQVGDSAGDLVVRIAVYGLDILTEELNLLKEIEQLPGDAAVRTITGHDVRATELGGMAGGQALEVNHGHKQIKGQMGR